MVTVEGIYENGSIELTEKPQGVKRARVQVTFFEEERESALATGERHPAELQQEYQMLILKKLHRNLTEAEAARLGMVREEINRRDRRSATGSLREKRAREVEQKLSALRQELDALPDA